MYLKCILTQRQEILFEENFLFFHLSLPPDLEFDATDLSQCHSQLTNQSERI